MLESGRYNPEYRESDEREFNPEEQRQIEQELIKAGYAEIYADPDVLVVLPESLAAEALRRAYELGHRHPRFWLEPKNLEERWKKREVRVTEGEPPHFRRTGRPIDGLK